MAFQRAAAFVLAFALAAGALAAPRESELLLEREGVIAGTLALSDAAGPGPVVLLVAGSGPTDRNGNSPGLSNNSLQALAHALAASGIASLRYDKRGIGASRAAGAREADMSIDRYADDAAAWVRLLQRDPRFSRTVIVGHSEGALVGMLAARRAGAGGFVSLAGPGERLSAVLRRQLAGKLPPALLVENERILSGLEQGRMTFEVPAPLAVLYRPSVQPFLLSAFKYDPAQEFGKLTMPAAVFQGDADLQVGVIDARKLQGARPGTPLVLVAGMNHVLKMAQGDLAAQMPSYITPDLPLAPQLVAELVKFVTAAN